jgi:hypothetical protein
MLHDDGKGMNIWLIWREERWYSKRLFRRKLSCTGDSSFRLKEGGSARGDAFQEIWLNSPS